MFLCTEKQLQIGSESTERQSRQRLGEGISKLIFGGDNANLQLSSGYAFTNEVIIYFDVFHALMKDGVGR
jgi:hypothetical protein